MNERNINVALTQCGPSTHAQVRAGYDVHVVRPSVVVVRAVDQCHSGLQPFDSQSVVVQVDQSLAELKDLVVVQRRRERVQDPTRGQVAGPQTVQSL